MKAEQSGEQSQETRSSASLAVMCDQVGRGVRGKKSNVEGLGGRGLKTSASIGNPAIYA
jgi:hypothetical protein